MPVLSQPTTFYNLCEIIAQMNNNTNTKNDVTTQVIWFTVHGYSAYGGEGACFLCFPEVMNDSTRTEDTKPVNTINQFNLHQFNHEP